MRLESASIPHPTRAAIDQRTPCPGEYNSIFHLAAHHFFAANQFPSLPLELVVNMHILRDEEAQMSIDASATAEFRDTWTVPGSDDIEVYKESVSTKRERAGSAVVKERVTKVGLSLQLFRYR